MNIQIDKTYKEIHDILEKSGLPVGVAYLIINNIGHELLRAYEQVCLKEAKEENGTNN